MAKGLNLKAVISLEKKQFVAGLNSIKKELRSFSGLLKSTFALGGITMFGRQMVQVGADFENAMAKVQAVSNATTKEFQAMQKEAQRLGATTKYTATEAASALENLTRNGLKAADATKALSKVLQLAQANAIDLATAADIVTNTMNAFGLSVNELQRVNDVMSSTAANAATNINDLYEAMSVAGPYAKIMNATIEETAAAIGTLANMGIKGSNAGKTLAAMYQRLSAITPKAAKELQKYGLNLDEAAIKSQDLATTLKQLNESGIGNSVEALSNLFGKNYAGNVAQLINSVGEFNTMLNVTANAAGTTERMFEQGVGSVRKELDTLKSSYEGLLISISQKTSGVVKGAIRLLQNLITNFKSVGGTIMNIASVAVPLLGSNITKLVRVIKTAATETAAATALAGGWITAIASLVTWVGTALVGAWNRAHQAMKDATKDLENVERESRKAQTALDNLAAQLGPDTDDTSLAGIVKRLTEMFPEFANAIQEAADEAGRTGNWDKLKRTLQDIKDLQDDILTKEAKEKLHDAQVGKLGHQLWRTSGVRGGMIVDEDYNPMNPIKGWPNLSNTRAVREINNTINKSLKNSGFSKEAIQKEYNTISDIILKNTSDEEAAQELAKELRDLNVKLEKPDEDLKRYVSILRQSKTLGSFWYSQQPDDNIAEYRETTQQVHEADSTVAVKSIELARKTLDSAIANANAAKNDKKITETEFQRKTSDALDAYANVLGQYYEYATAEQKKELAELRDIYKAPVTRHVSGGAGGSGGGKSEKTAADGVSAILKNFNESLEKLEARNAAGTIDNFTEEVDKLKTTTYESLSEFKDLDEIIKTLGEDSEVLVGGLRDYYKRKKINAGVEQYFNEQNAANARKASQTAELGNYKLPQKGTRDSFWDFEKKGSDILSEQVRIEFDYSEALQKLVADLDSAIKEGRFDDIKGDAINVLAEIKKKAEEAGAAAETLSQKLTLAEATEKLEDLEKQMRELASNTLSELSTVFDRLYSAVQGIAEAFGEELEWEGLEKLIKVINGAVQIFQVFKTVIEAVRAAEELAQRKRDMAAAKQIAENAAIATSEGTKAAAEGAAAAAGGASAVSSIPVVGPVLAVAAVAAIVAAIIAGMQKFSTGGIVGGNSFSGDKTVARVNSGEAVLTRQQQSTLFDILNGKTSVGGGQVEFKIRGSDLIGAINNENMRRRG